jgi:hypothetical protein
VVDPTPAPSAVVLTPLLAGHAAAPPPKIDWTTILPSLRLSYPRLLESIFRRPSFDPSIHLRSDIFQKVVTPYDPAAFSFFLDKYDLRDSYPDLISFLAHGFPIGVMPALEATNILNNHPSIFLHPDLVDNYLSEEVSSGRVDGPFSRSQVFAIMRGHFQSSPLVVISQPQAPGEPDKVRICRHLSKASSSILSVNSFIRTTLFPTRFDTAARVAELVSHLPSLPLPVQVTHLQPPCSRLRAPLTCFRTLSSFPFPPIFAPVPHVLTPI